MTTLSRMTLIPALTLCLPWAVLAAADLEETSSSPDVTIVLDGQLVDDEDAVVLNGAPAAVEDLGPLASALDLQAIDIEDSGDALFVLDITSPLGGPRDVLRYNGSTYSLEFDGGSNGLPSGSRIDALSQTSDGDLLMSFDITVALPGLTVDDEDVVRWDSSSGFSLEFDGSTAGIASYLDTDSLHLVEASQNLLLSFDGSGVVDGLNFDDEDVLEYDPDTGNWEFSVDSSATGTWPAAADRDAFHAVRSCAALGGDSDADKLCQDEDPCLGFQNTLPAAFAAVPDIPNGDVNQDGVPNECQCGDPNGSGGHESDDLFQAFNCLQVDPENMGPVCAQRIIKGDANNTGRWESDDLFRIFRALNQTDPGWLLTCAARPEGTEPPPLP